MVVTFLGSLVQSCCGERGTLQRNITGLCVNTGSAHSDSAALGLPRSLLVGFRGLHCSGSRSLCQELSVAGPGLRALPRSKPLRFRFSGTPQSRRFGWACVLCPSQVGAAQVTRCLESTVAPPVGDRVLLPPCPSAPFLGVQRGAPFQVCLFLFWGTDLWLRLSWRMPTVQNPKKPWLTTKPAYSLVEDASLGQ